MVKIVCDDAIPFLKGVFEPYARVEYLPGRKIDSSDVRDADALIVRTRTKCDKALLEGSKVKVIASATIGYDHIYTSWCTSHGIVWTNAPGCNSGSVRQYIASVLVTLSGRFGFSLRGKTLGVVGVGHVGSKVAKLARALGMNILLNDPPRAEKEGAVAHGVNGEDFGGAEFVSLERLTEGSDIITLHVPLDESTRHLFDRTRLAALRTGQILINSSRGEVVDNQALKEALSGKRLLAGVLDVWENEPEIDTNLLDLLAIATPHIAGYSADGKANGTGASVRAVAKVLGISELYDWKVGTVPGGGVIAPIGHSDESLIADAILHTYDVRQDDARLRSDVGSFEALRKNYPLRREFEAYTIMGNIPEVVSETLESIGFKA